MSEADYYELEQRAHNRELAIREAREVLARAETEGDTELIAKINLWLGQI